MIHACLVNESDGSAHFGVYDTMLVYVCFIKPQCQHHGVMAMMAVTMVETIMATIPVLQ